MNLISLNLSQPEIKAAVTPSVVGFEDAGQFYEIFRDTKTASGKVVSPEKALRCSAVLACIRILAEDIASLPLLLKKRTPFGASEAVDHPAYRLLKAAPNDFQTAFELREHMMMDSLLTGYFYNWQQRNGSGKLTGIVPVPAHSVQFSHQLPDGTLIWKCGAPGFPTQFAHWDLWRGTFLNNGVIGARSLILLAREAIGLALAAEEQGARLFSNGVQTDLVLETTEELSGPEKDQLRDAFAAKHSGSKQAWLPLVLSGGMKATKIGLTAEESQYMDSRAYQTADIARIFRMPGVMLGLGDKTNTFAAASEFFQAYSKYTLGPWTRRFEETAERDLLLKRESDFFIRHDFTQLLRADQKTRFQTYKEGIQGGFMQPAEARIAEDWNEIPGLDFTLVPANYAYIKDGEVIAVPTAKGGNAGEPFDVPEDPASAADAAQPPASPAKPKSPSARRLAQRAAESVIKSEQRQFARARVSEAALAGFAAWHLDKVQEATGTDAVKAAAYSAWRLDNKSADAEATERLINLCMDMEESNETV